MIRTILIWKKEENKMKIALGSDHGGYNLKTTVAKHLKEKGYDFEDFGCFTCESCDYPDYALKVAEKVADGEFNLGIVVCGTGIGVSIAANKVPKIRAAHCTDTYSARYSRMHNDANILALGGRITGDGLALDIVDAFLTSKFEGGRHAKRVDKITAIEKKYNK